VTFSDNEENGWEMFGNYGWTLKMDGGDGEQNLSKQFKLG